MGTMLYTHKQSTDILDTTVLGVDVGGKYRFIVSNGKHFQGNDIYILSVELLKFCEDNNYIYLGIENPGLLSKRNRNTYKALTVIETVSRKYKTNTIRVDPMLTSRICHRCHSISKKTKRIFNVFVCEYCNLTVDSDYNASMNIRQRAIQTLRLQ